MFEDDSHPLAGEQFIVSVVPEDERMRAYGLSIQNYIKGGDAGAARRRLEGYKQVFSGKDLYYPDGSSFRSTIFGRSRVITGFDR